MSNPGYHCGRAQRQLQANPESRDDTMNTSGFPVTPFGVAKVCASRLRRLSHPGMTVGADQNFSTHGRISSSELQALRGCCKTFQ